MSTTLEHRDLRTAVRTQIAHRRCLICGRRGDVHRVQVTVDGGVAIWSADGQHRYDPGERRLGLTSRCP